MEIVTVIPARMASARLPGKPLRRLGPSTAAPTLLEATYARAKAAGLGGVFVATSDDLIARFCIARGLGLIRGGPADTGTQRVATALQEKFGKESFVAINLQCDEPEMPPEFLTALAHAATLEDEYTVTTLAAPLSPAAWGDRAVVKAVCTDHRCHWFTRYGVPGALAHIGVYAWKTGPAAAPLAGVLRRPPRPAARLEGLEQLTWLEYNVRIVPVRVPYAPAAVNTSAELEILIKKNS